MIEWLAAPLGLLLVAGVVLVLRHRHRSLVSQKREAMQNVIEVLSGVAEEAERRQKHLHLALDAGDGDIPAELARLKGDCPEECRAEVEEVQRLWDLLNSQLEQFAGQDSHNTLQSSVLTTRAANVARDIERQVAAIRTRLAALQD